MTVPAADARFDADPSEALAAIEAHDGPVVVDLDETLLLANSTTLFLDSARPAFLVYLVVKMLDIALPGRRARAIADRDTRRVRAVLAALPWSGWWWRRRARQLGPELFNRPLIDAISEIDGPVVISTKGFRPIVEPIIAAAGLSSATVVAMDPRNTEDRDEAKFRLTVQAVEPATIDRCLVVTDSMADQRLLEASGTPLRVDWPLVPIGALFAKVYFPGRYLAVKRPNAHYVRKIVKEDLAFWILGSVWLADRPLTHVIGLVLLALSFWAVYELGYVDNDRVAERYETDPALSDVYYRRAVQFRLWKPAAFAVLSAVLGLFVLRWPSAPERFDYLRWVSVLVVTWSVFWLYNRFDKQTRVLLYPLLQLARLGAFLAVVGTTPIADMALIIMTLLRWVSYFVYRSRSGRWPNDDFSVIQLIVFVAASVLLASQHEWSDLVAPTTLSLFVWMVFLARHLIPSAVAQAHRIDRASVSASDPSDSGSG